MTPGLRHFCFLRGFHSMKEVFIFMITIATFSTLITYHMALNQAQDHVKVDNTEEQFNMMGAKWLAQYREQSKGKMKTIIRSEVQSLKKVKKHQPRSLSHLADREEINERLRELENRIQTLSQHNQVLLVGSNNSLKQQKEILQQGIHANNMQVAINEDVGERSVSGEASEDQHNPNWSLAWCLDTDCLSKIRPHPYSRINQIPSVLKILTNDKSLCDLQKSFQSAWEVPCSCHTPLSSGASKLLQAFSRKQKTKFKFAVRRPHVHKEEIELLSDIPPDLIGSDSLVWACPQGLLTLGGQPFYAEVTIMLASLSPIRLYVYPNIQMVQTLTGAFDQKSAYSIFKLRKDIQTYYGKEASKLWWNNLRQEIFALMLKTEFYSCKKYNSEDCDSCSRCFQLLKLDVLFTSDFHTSITKAAMVTAHRSNYDIIDDTLRMMTTTDYAADDVAMTLDNISSDLELSIDPEVCQNTSSSICLTDTHLLNLLDNRLENLPTGSQFFKLYPSAKASSWTKMINQIQGKSPQEKSIKNKRQSSLLLTADLHQILLDIEISYSQAEGYAQDENNFIGFPNVPEAPKINQLPVMRNLKEDKIQDTENHETKKCNPDQNGTPHLSSVNFSPRVDLQPNFHPQISTYTTTVDYDTFLVVIEPVASHCHSQPRIDFSDAPYLRITNYSLGLGENVLKIYVVDTSQPDPVVIRTYVFRIYRQEQNHHLVSIGTAGMVTCSWKQDCDLKYISNESCGLQSYHGNHNIKLQWSDFIQKSQSLPSCTVSHPNSEWYVPCSNCQDKSSCMWRHAIWQSPSCHHRPLDTDTVQRCLAGKKLLFIGDSTNRGILHYIVERINGSLTDMDKTHGFKLYTNVNMNRTDFSFAYYPHFWLPNNHRPGFEKIVYQLIKSLLPLENNSNTVLVVGGVHWLSQTHLDVILKALQREKLAGIKLIMKGIGAGFHQPVNGIRYVPLEEHQRLLTHEKQLSQYGKSHGFDVVATYNMTMSRYKDFLQGKCACHFHKMKKIPPISIDDDSTNYHVDGQINSLYSEIVLHQICR